jgi:hypothetical protein
MHLHGPGPPRNRDLHGCQPRAGACAARCPRREPVSHNRVNPSPYYPVFGRRMVMIGHARRPISPHGGSAARYSRSSSASFGGVARPRCADVASALRRHHAVGRRSASPRPLVGHLGRTGRQVAALPCADYHISAESHAFLMEWTCVRYNSHGLGPNTRECRRKISGGLAAIGAVHAPVSGFRSIWKTSRTAAIHGNDRVIRDEKPATGDGSPQAASAALRAGRIAACHRQQPAAARRQMPGIAGRHEMTRDNDIRYIRNIRKLDLRASLEGYSASPDRGLLAAAPGLPDFPMAAARGHRGGHAATPGA